MRRGRTLLALAAVVVLVVAAVVGLHARQSGRGYSDSHGNDVVRYTLDSRLLGRSLEEIAIVPSGSGSGRGLLVFLHGRHDPSRLAWLVGGTSGPESVLGDALLAAVARQGVRAPVVVLLSGDGHSYFHDRREGKWGSMVLGEAIPDAARRFHTAPGKLAIGGISMGGYGALHLAALAPGRFCAVGGHSAALWTSGGASAPGAFDDAEDYAANDVFAAARAGRYNGVPVWRDGGTDDPFRQADDAFADALRARGGDVTRRTWPGGHTGAYWHAHEAAYLDFYARALAACAR